VRFDRNDSGFAARSWLGHMQDHEFTWAKSFALIDFFGKLCRG
jgi:hypothetical protein